MKGTYVLLIKLEKPKRIRIGSLGFVSFRKGYYAYVGSGLNSLEKRIERHFSRNKKKFWHIDYFLEWAKPEGVIYFESGKMEYEVAGKLREEFECVRNFGCSDCKCESHLFCSEKPMEKRVVSIVRNLRGLQSPPRILGAGVF